MTNEKPLQTLKTLNFEDHVLYNDEFNDTKIKEIIRECILIPWIKHFHYVRFSDKSEENKFHTTPEREAVRKILMKIGGLEEEEIKR